ncbi:hypothetical protein ACFXTN_023275 [Malus domestica]
MEVTRWPENEGFDYSRTRSWRYKSIIQKTRALMAHVWDQLKVGGVEQVCVDVEERLCCRFYLGERGRGPGRGVLAYGDRVWVRPGGRRENGESGHWKKIWLVGFLRILTTKILLSLGDVMAGEIDIF